MIKFAEKIRTYTNGLDQARFVASRLTDDTILLNQELIGEAATHIPNGLVPYVLKFPNG